MELVEALNKEELRSFKLFLKQYQVKSSGLLIGKLLDSYKLGNKSDNDIRANVFPMLKKNAFYQLKSRMIESIYKSLILLNYNKDENILIKNYLTLAQIFTYKAEYSLAYKILKKAEKKAIGNDFLFLSYIIYSEIIDLSIAFNEIELPRYLNLKKETLVKIQENEKIEYLTTEIGWRLQQTNFEGTGISIIDELEKIKSKLENVHLIKNNHNIQLQLQKTVRNILLQKGDFNSLEIYLENKLAEFEKLKIFKKTNHNHKIVMQVWLINSLLKLKKFQKVEIVTETLMKDLIAFNKLHYNKFIWTYFQSKFISTYFLGDLKKSLEVLVFIESQPKTVNLDYYNLFLNQNFFIIYYSLNNYKKANQHLNELLKPKLYKTLSPELKMSVNVVDLIMYYENNDYNYLIYRIKEIKRKFRTSLSKPNFERVKSFLNLLDVLSKYPNPFENKKVLPKLQQFIANSPPFEPGNNENINYKVWLLSKLNKRSYFDELLLEVKTD